MPDQSTAPVGASTQRVYPFRHFEERFFLPTMLGCMAAMVTIRMALATIDGYGLVLYCSLLGAVFGAVSWLRLRSRFRSVMPQIVRGPKRVAALGVTVAFCFASAISAAALLSNRYMADGTLRVVDAKVVRAGPVLGPKLWGWQATFAFEGDSYYQMVAPEHAAVAMSSRSVDLGLKKGLLGYEYIVSVRPLAPVTTAPPGSG